MRVVVAPDKFKGSATAPSLTAAIAAAVHDLGHEPVEIPMADGGDGTLDALGGANRRTTVTGPLGEPVDAEWRLSKGTAVIEMARASGLVLAGGAEGNRPLDATTRGTGELIAAALARGARHIIVGLGGAATTDGGLGAVEAIGSPGRLAAARVEAATDVTTEFVDAAQVFGPQKGASAAQVAFLEARLRALAERYRDLFGVDVEGVRGAGAAGGLGGGLYAVGAHISSGFDLIADAVGLFEAIEDADLVITGEGQIDEESFAGKVVGGIAEMCTETATPLLLVAGAVLDDVNLGPGVTARALVDEVGLDRAMAETCAAAAQVVTGFLERF